MRKKLAMMMSLMLMVSLCQGCWNYREVDMLQVVAGFAVDKGYEGKKYHMTIDLANTSSAGKDKPVSTTILETEGDTVFDAVRNTVKKTGNKLYWSDCQIVVIGSDVAEESILPIVDFLMRDAEPRLTINLLISKEKTAKEVLTAMPATVPIASFEIDKEIELNAKNQGTTVAYKVYEVYNQLADKNKGVTMAVIHNSENNGKLTNELDGIAVLRNDRLIGFLTPDDARNFLFVVDQVLGGVLLVKASTGNVIAALEISENKTSIKPEYDGDRITLHIKTSTTAALGELDTTQDYINKEGRKKLKLMAEQQLQNQIRDTIQMVQNQFGVDIFGFDDVVHKSNLVIWNRVKDDWPETFKNLKIDVLSEIDIVNSAYENTPVEGSD
jgi:spore germination protein KC